MAAESNKVIHESLDGAINALADEIVFIKNDAINPHFKNRYASLKGVITNIKAPMKKHGLSYRQRITNIDGKVALETAILHTSGQSETAIAPLEHKPNDPQSVGSAITYYRRYMLLTQLGLLTDDDDDGNLASGREEQKTTAEVSRDFWLAKSNLTKTMTKKGMTIDSQKELVQKTLGKPKIENIEDIHLVAEAAGIK